LRKTVRPTGDGFSVRDLRGFGQKSRYLVCSAVRFITRRLKKLLNIPHASGQSLDCAANCAVVRMALLCAPSTHR
jgi:hypothetical protein